MFVVKKYENIQLMISLLPVLLLIEPHRSQIMTQDTHGISYKGQS